jgi:hypothetical protein
MSSPLAQRFNSSDTSNNLSGVSFPFRELLKLPLRAVYQAEVFAFVTVPQSLTRLVGLEAVVNPALVGNIWAGGEDRAAAMAGAEAGVDDTGLSFTDFLQAMRRFSGFFSYMTSRWSLACFCVVCMRYISSRSGLCLTVLRL